MGSEGDCSHRNNMDNNIDDSEPPLKKAQDVGQVKSKNMEKDTQNENEDKNLSENEPGSCHGLIRFLTSCDDITGSSDDEILFKYGKIPVTLVKPDPKHEDYYLQKWQAKHTATDYMDNTRNILREVVFPDLEALLSIENFEDDDQVEDKGTSE